jgi:hypothetical protein
VNKANFSSLKIVQHKILDMCRGHLFNFEALIVGDNYHIFQQSVHCGYCKRQNANLRPDDRLFCSSLKVSFHGVTFQCFSHLLR